MRIAVLEGLIKRRILVNYAADPNVIQNLLPSPFRPKLFSGRAIVGICLIELNAIRPKGVPAMFGVNSQNAAHRIAVQWDRDGEAREGVYIPRRDTGSALNAFAGGRIFPGQHHKSSFKISESDEKVRLSMVSNDSSVLVSVNGEISDAMPDSSIFQELSNASDFFRTGSLGYSVNGSGNCLHGVILKTKCWVVRPLQIKSVYSSFFEDTERFPQDSIKFDHALIMHNIEHEWHSAEDFPLAH